MTLKLTPKEQARYAMLGIQSEIEKLRALLPANANGNGNGKGHPHHAMSKRKHKKRGRPPLSAKARKAISDRMVAMWDKKRAGRVAKTEAATKPRKYRRKGKHWTQLPKNRAKLVAILSKAAKARTAQLKAEARA